MTFFEGNKEYNSVTQNRQKESDLFVGESLCKLYKREARLSTTQMHQPYTYENRHL